MTLNSHLIAIWNRLKQIVPLLLVLVFIITFTVLSYMSIMPRDDEVEKAKGDKKIEELDLSFDKKLLLDISSSKEPATAVSGRNPFSN